VQLQGMLFLGLLLGWQLMRFAVMQEHLPPLFLRSSAATMSILPSQRESFTADAKPGP